MNFIVWNIFCNDAASRCHGAFTEFNPSEKNGFGPDPGAVSQVDGVHNQSEGRIGPIMIARAEIATLR